MRKNTLISKLAIAASGLALAIGSLSSVAGPQYVDASGYAVSGYDVVAYRPFEQGPLGESQIRAVPGKSSITAEWNGVTWAFSTAENRDRFLANPKRYAPAYDGHCAYGAALNGKVPANPNLWRIVDDRLYLNVTRTVVGLWEEDIDSRIRQADTNWPDLEAKPATHRKVPEFDIHDAPTS